MPSGELEGDATENETRHQDDISSGLCVHMIPACYSMHHKNTSHMQHYSVHYRVYIISAIKTLSAPWVSHKTKQKTVYEILTPSIKTPYKLLWTYVGHKCIYVFVTG